MTKPMFSKRHFEAIAKVLEEINYLDNRMVAVLAEDFCVLFRGDNNNFSREKFLEACGVD